jgi:hypothetical protein
VVLADGEGVDSPTFDTTEIEISLLHHPTSSFLMATSYDNIINGSSPPSPVRPSSPDTSWTASRAASTPFEANGSGIDLEYYDERGSESQSDIAYTLTPAMEGLGKRKASEDGADMIPAKRLQLRENVAQYIPKLVASFKLSDSATIRLNNFAQVRLLFTCS